MTDHHDCYSVAEYTDLLARTKRLSDQINAVLNLCALAEQQQPGRLPAVLTAEIREALEVPRVGLAARLDALLAVTDESRGIMRAEDARAALLREDTADAS